MNEKEAAALEGREETPYPISLIELSVAAADACPVVDISELSRRTPKAGYWYVALRHLDETSATPDRFAAGCFPADYGTSGRTTFIIDETNTVYAKDLGHGHGISVFPPNPVAEGWRKLD